MNPRSRFGKKSSLFLDTAEHIVLLQSAGALLPAAAQQPQFRPAAKLYLARLPGKTHETRSEIITRMAERGVACNVHYKPLPLLTAYKNLGFRMEEYPNAYAQFENEITLPLHTLLTDEDIDYVCACLKECL